MQCTRSLVKNWDLDCFRIVTKKQPELFRPDREQGVGHKPRLGNLHTNRHQLNLLWESIVWIWLRWIPSGHYPPAQKDLKHLCCSATTSCLNPEGLLPMKWVSNSLLCFPSDQHQQSAHQGNTFLNHSIQCHPTSSILMTRVPCRCGSRLSSGSISTFWLKYILLYLWVHLHVLAEIYFTQLFPCQRQFVWISFSVCSSIILRY